MNKQAVTFLSLFSVLLVLSVYYILLPPVTNPTPVAVEKIELSKIETLQEELITTRNQVIMDNNDIIAASSSSSKDIQVALEVIADTQKIQDQEKAIVELLKGLGYEKVFVECENKNIKVVIEKKDAKASDANEIIKLIVSKYDNSYQIEVKFI